VQVCDCDRGKEEWGVNTFLFIYFFPLKSGAEAADLALLVKYERTWKSMFRSFSKKYSLSVTQPPADVSLHPIWIYLAHAANLLAILVDVCSLTFFGFVLVVTGHNLTQLYLYLTLYLYLYPLSLPLPFIFTFTFTFTFIYTFTLTLTWC
jgi:hypothetical protein